MKPIIDPKHMAGIRDIADAREAADQFFSIRKMQVAKHGPRVGARRYPRTGAPGSAYDPTCIARTDGRGRVDDERCTDTPQNCHAAILGFNSVEGEVAGGSTFPLAGGGGAAIATSTLIISSGNAGSYRASEFFFEARDAAAGFGAVPGLVTSAQISGSEQLVGAGGAFGITSAVFALTNEPLPVNWIPWQDSGQQRLQLQFGNFLAAAVTIEVFGCFWGDRVPQ